MLIICFSINLNVPHSLLQYEAKLHMCRETLFHNIAERERVTQCITFSQAKALLLWASQNAVL